MSKSSVQPFTRRDILAFISTPIAIRFGLGVLIGLLQFGVELGFAASLQAFLLRLEIASPGSVEVPAFLLHQSLAAVLGILCVIVVLRNGFLWAQSYLQGSTLEYFRYLQRKRMIRWVFGSRSASSAQITGLFTETLNYAASSILQLQATLAPLVSGVFIGLTLLWLEPKLTLAAAFCLALLFPLLKMFGRKIGNTGTEVTLEWEVTNRRLVMGIKNLLLLRIYAMEERERAEAERTLSRYLHHSFSYYKLSSINYVLPQTIGGLLVCGIALYAHANLDMTPGVLVSYFYLFFRLIQSLSQVSFTVSNFLFQLPHLRQVADWWAAHGREAERLEAETRGTSHEPALSQALGWSFRNLSFTYPEGQIPVFTDFELEIPPGSATVIIGPSGVGKSTLLALLLGELEATRGEVISSSGGIRPDRHQLLSSIGYVGPESFLFEGTIYENVVFGLEKAPSESEIAEAIEQAQCQFIYDLPARLQHLLTEQGQGLSAGQKQRISLLRALLRRPKALILDEATSNLDHDTENRLIATLAGLKGKMTLVVVTHREGMLRLADAVVKLGGAN